MATIKKNEFRQMNEKQLSSKLVELKKELMQINTQISKGTVPENPGGVREVKKTIARINNALNSIKQKNLMEDIKKQ